MSPNGFAQMTKMMSYLADGKVIMALEVLSLACYFLKIGLFDLSLMILISKSREVIT